VPAERRTYNINMPNYRRSYLPGGTYFFTHVTDHRSPFLCTDLARKLLKDVFRETRQRWPFHIDAIVLLPDHLHAIWTLPPGDADYSKRWGWLKKEFSKRYVAARRPDKNHGVWQPKFWEHTIRDENDYERHMDYIHYNPVKHGLVRCPRDWHYSSFARWVRLGIYPHDWGCPDFGKNDGNWDFDDLRSTIGE